MAQLATGTSSQTTTTADDENTGYSGGVIAEEDKADLRSDFERIESKQSQQQLQQSVIHALEQPTTKTTPSQPQTTTDCCLKPALEQDNADAGACVREATAISAKPSCPSNIQIFSGEEPEKLAQEPERVSCDGALGASATTPPVSFKTKIGCDDSTLSTSCSDSNIILTSLLARVDEVKRDTVLVTNSSKLIGVSSKRESSNDITGETAGVKKKKNISSEHQANDSCQVQAIASAVDESLRSACYDSDSSGLCWTPNERKLSQASERIITDHQEQENSNNQLVDFNKATAHQILQLLGQKRDELRELDRQLSLMMTQYLTTLELGCWPTRNSTNAQYGNDNTAIPLTLSQSTTYDHTISHPHLGFVSYAEHNDDAIDLSLVSAKLALSANSPYNSIKNHSNDKPSPTKKPSPGTVNLKKSRLLGAASALTLASDMPQTPSPSSQSININVSIDQARDQTSPLNLLTHITNIAQQQLPPLRTGPATSPGSTHTFTSTSSSFNTSTDLTRGRDASNFYLDMRQEKQHQAAYSLANNTGNSALVSYNQASLASNEYEQSRRINDQYHSNFKKFRSNGQPTYEDYYNRQISNAAGNNNSNDNYITKALAEAEIETLNQSQALRRQQQALLADFYSSHHLSFAPVTLFSDKPHLINNDIASFSHDATNNVTKKPVEMQYQQLAPVRTAPVSNTSAAIRASSNAAKLAQSELQKIAFRCHVCGSGFEDRHRLQQHLSIHLNLDPNWFEERTIKETMAQYESKRGDYLCDRCQIRFETTAEFDRHMALHGEKPHCCELCFHENKSISFRYYRQLLTHLRSHCFIYSCRFVPECKQTANRKDYLKLHILKHHLNNKLPEQYTICCQNKCIDL